MANALSEDLTERYVVLKEKSMSPTYRDIKYRVYLVRGGFGASPATRGTGLHGATPIDGESFRMEGHDVERFATDEEIALVHTRWFVNEEGLPYDHDMRTQEAEFPNDDHTPYPSRRAAEEAADKAEAEAEEKVFQFLVTVETDTREHAEQVMAERVNHDEELGFEYTIDWGVGTVSRELVAQAQTTKMYGHWYFGWEIFDVDGSFHLIIHTTTYDGIRVDSHYATPQQAMESLTRDEAIQEAARKTAAYARTVLGEAGV